MKGLNNFTFETNSRCELGGGVWRLLTHEASILNREFQAAASDCWRKYEREMEKEKETRENGVDENTPLKMEP